MSQARFENRSAFGLFSRGVLVRGLPTATQFASVLLVAFSIVILEASRLVAGTSGTWISSGGIWSSTVNWSGGIVADGVDGAADFSTLNITANQTVVLDTSRSIGSLEFGDTTPSNDWSLGGNSGSFLTFGVSSGNPLITVVNRTATIGVPLGGATVSKDGAGTLVLNGTSDDTGLGLVVNAGAVILSKSSGANVHAIGSGGLSIEGGSVQLGGTGSDQILDQAGLTIDAGSFDLNGLNEAVDSLNGMGGIVTNTKASSTSKLTFGASGSGGLFSGVIQNGASGQGIVSPIKSGAGTITLTGNNAFTGGMTIQNGTLVLTGNNSFTGGLTVSNGTLRVATVNNANSSGPLGTNSKLVLGSSGTGTLEYTGITASTNMPLSLGGSFPATPTVQIDAPDTNLTLTGVVSGGPLFKSGPGTLTLSANNTFTGLTVSNGILRVATINYSTSGPLGINAEVALGSATQTGTLEYTGNTITSVMPFTLAGIGGGFQIDQMAANLTLTGTIQGTGGLTKSGPGMLTLGTPNSANPNTFSGGLIIDAGTVQLGGAGALNSNGTDSLSFGAGSTGILTLNGNSVTVSGLSSNGGSAVVQNQNLNPATLTVNNAGDDLFDGVLKDGIGKSLALTKNGAGTLTLSGNNTLTGRITINQGNLSIGSSGALNSMAPDVVNFSLNVTQANGLNLNGFSTTVADLNGGGPMTVVQNGGSTPATLTVNLAALNDNESYGGILEDGGAGPLALVKTGLGILGFTPNANGNSFTGGLTIAAGGLGVGTINNANTNGPVGNTPLITLGSPGQVGLIGCSGGNSNMPFVLVGGGGAISIGSPNGLTLTGKISGTGGLEITSVPGGGTVTLAGDNTFTGGVTINACTLVLGGSGALNSALPNPVSMTNVNFNGFSTLILNGNNLTVPALNSSESSSRFIVENASSNPATLAIRNDSACAFYGSLSDGSGGGPLAVAKDGQGILTLDGFSTFTGGMTISSGTLSVGFVNSTISSGPLGESPSVTLGSDGQIATLDVTSFDSSPSDFQFTLAAKGVGTIQIDSPKQNLTLTGVISGAGRLEKRGPGTLTLSASNAYTGTTTVSAGVMAVTGTIAGNRSNSVFISAGTDFTSASLVRRVQSGSTYSGLGSTAIGSGVRLLGTSADIRAGQNNAATYLDVAMQWRVRGAADGFGVASDVLQLTGMGSPGDHVQTDPFTLQMTYNPAALGGDENTVAANGLLALAWLNTGVNQPNGLWQNATAGNFGAGLPGDVFQNVQSSWDAFAAANSITDSNLGVFLGSNGVDVTTHTVWAVVNHNSQFAAVPEPSSFALAIGAGFAGLIAVRRWRLCRRMK